jgi:hypothetical protein
MPSKASPSKPFPFLSLPPELRTKIYLLLVQSPDLYVQLDPKRRFANSNSNVLVSKFPYYPAALLKTCSQINQEAGPLYFTTNAFSLLLNREHFLFDYFLQRAFTRNRRMIRSLRITIVRFGRKDFFYRELAPILQDMIINGCLRELKIRLKKCHFLEFGCAEHNLLQWRQDEKFLNVRAILALREICEDPYLEKVKVETFMPNDEIGVLELPELKPGEVALGEGPEWDVLEDVTYVLDRAKRQEVVDVVMEDE